VILCECSNLNMFVEKLSPLIPAWQKYRGRSQILCAGHCVTSECSWTGQGIFYLTLLLILLPSSGFLAFDCRYLAVNASPAIPVIAVILLIFVMSMLLRAAFMDPGIVPRATIFEEIWVETRPSDEPEPTPGTLRPPPKIQSILINGQEFKLKYCYTCKMFRPPRSSHCSICDNCIDRFDHHCPWVGNCVGRRNYRYFYLFLLSVSIYCSFVCGMVIYNLMLLTNMTDDFWIAVKISPTSILIGIIAFISLMSIVSLVGFHSFLVAKETSTNEDIKGTFKASGNTKIENPFDRGCWYSNLAYVLFGPTPPSLLLYPESIDDGTLRPRKRRSPSHPNSEEHSSKPSGSENGTEHSLYPRDYDLSAPLRSGIPATSSTPLVPPTYGSLDTTVIHIPSESQ
jgi:palmitoyltransferase ZDHHC9/14/18